MSEHFKIGTERTYNDQDRPTIRLDISVSFGDDAPPALARAIFEGITKLLIAGTDDEYAAQLARDFQEINERKQRQADNVARLLIGDGEPGAGGGEG